ncbi:hypothetical protein [Haloferax sulfurifontis]|uniref:Small CPxCG-related zinc finger protein n=1 Tax=Haloferax sulfurifontis TaxID=255616 RepID=A0A830E304_9EURY|nr:hypothetical protein [Haloferax sulfurifontis]GGC72178.1 hypothetical protein GCM10007209_37630 [Haloferax sulfurifontis]
MTFWCDICEMDHATTVDEDGYTLGLCPMRGTVLVDAPEVPA